MKGGEFCQLEGQRGWWLDRARAAIMINKYKACGGELGGADLFSMR